MGLFVTKLLLGGILLSGVISTVSLPVAANATTTTTDQVDVWPRPTTTNQVIAGDTQEYRIYEGLAPTMEPWENGMRTNPMPGTFEWWYFQTFFTDGSQTQITWLTKPWMDNNGPLQPYITITIITPNGTALTEQVNVNIDQFKAARDTVNVTMGDSWVRGDLNTIQEHIPTTPKGLGVDLVFEVPLHPQDLVAVVCGISTHR